MNSKTGVILLTVGSPESPDKSNVRKYLYQFLNDKRIIDVSWLVRKLLVSLIIIPFRVSRVSKLYKKLWTDRGSPLIFYGISVQKKLQQKLGEDYVVEFAANYGKPGINEVVDKVLKQNVKRIIAFPLFPQYSSPATGSAIEKLLKSVLSQYNIPAITTIMQYYENPFYLEAMALHISAYDYRSFDHILLSFHGLPINQVIRSHYGKPCEYYKCTSEVSEHNQYCYHASCYATARLLARLLKLDKNMYTVCFQSRMGKNWLAPFTDNVIKKMAMEGKKRLLVICPSFTADCLETTIEAGHFYRDIFLQNGGENLTLVESLNDSDRWIDAIEKMISAHAIDKTLINTY